MKPPRGLIARRGDEAAKGLRQEGMNLDRGLGRRACTVHMDRGLGVGKEALIWKEGFGLAKSGTEVIKLHKGLGRSIRT